MSKRPTIVIISANYKRPEITELFVLGLLRLRRAISEDFPVVVVGEPHSMFKEANIEFYAKENEPVSDKFNLALHHAMKHNPKHIMVLGSDDLIHDEVFKDFINVKDNIDYLGFQWVYYYSLEPKSVGKIKQQMSSIIVGAGRTMSMDLLNRCKTTKLWSKPMNRSLDNLMYSNLHPYIQTRYQHPGYVIDIKSPENINNFDKWNLKYTDAPEGYVTGGLSDEERQLLYKLKDKVKNEGTTKV